MVKQKSSDFKLAAVLYYLNNDVSYTEVCNIFNCNRRSLKRWIEKYDKENRITNNSKSSISYKLRKIHLDYLLKLLKNNEQITLKELCKLVKEKYKDFDITPQHLGRVLDVKVL